MPGAVVRWLGIRDKAVKLHFRNLGSLYFNTPIEYPLLKTPASMDGLDSVISGLPEEVKVLRSGGYYNSLVVSAPIGLENRLRDIGFDTGSKRLILRNMFLPAPSIVNLDEDAYRLAQAAEHFRVQRSQITKSIAAQSVNKGMATRRINLIDSIIKGHSSGTIRAELDNQPLLRGLSEEIRANIEALSEGFGELEQLASEKNARLSRVKTHKGYQWGVFFEGDIRDYVEFQRRLTTDEFKALRFGLIDIETPLYETLDVISWAALAVVSGGETVSRWLFTLHPLQAGEFMGYRVVKPEYSGISSVNPQAEYKGLEKWMMQQIGEVIEQEHVDVFCSWTSYDLLRMREAGLRIRDRRARVDAVQGFLRRVGLEEYEVMDLWAWFSGLRQLPDTKLSSVRAYLEGGSKPKLMDYTELARLEQSLLSNQQSKDALEQIAAYVISDVECLPAMLNNSDFYRQASALMNGFELWAEEVATPSSSKRLTELKFYQKYGLPQKATVFNMPWLMEHTRQNAKLLSNIINNCLLHSRGKVSAPCDDTCFSKPGIYTNALVAYIPIGAWFEKLLSKAAPSLEGILEAEHSGVENFKLAEFTNAFLVELLGTYARWRNILDEEQSSESREKAGGLWARIWYQHGLDMGETAGIVQGVCMRYGTELRDIVAKRGFWLYLSKPPDSSVPLLFMDSIPVLLVTRDNLIFRNRGSFNCFKAPCEEPERLAAPIEKRVLYALWDALESSHPEEFVDYFSGLCERAAAGELPYEDFLFKHGSNLMAYQLVRGVLRKAPIRPGGLDKRVQLQVFFGKDYHDFQHSRLGRYLLVPGLEDLILPVLRNFPGLFSRHWGAGGDSGVYSPSLFPDWQGPASYETPRERE